MAYKIVIQKSIAFMYTVQTKFRIYNRRKYLMYNSNRTKISRNKYD